MPPNRTPAGTPSLGAALGANVRQRREVAAMSLGQLAALSGISKGTVSMVESGQANPTVETVAALASAFGCTPPDLLTDPADPMLVDLPADSERKRIGVVEGRLLQRFAPTGPVELYEIVVRGRKRRRSPPHATGVYEHVWVADGRVEIGPIEAPFELGPGDYVCFSGWTEHTYRAIESPARGFMMLSYATPWPDVRILHHLP